MRGRGQNKRSSFLKGLEITQRRPCMFRRMGSDAEESNLAINFVAMRFGSCLVGLQEHVEEGQRWSSSEVQVVREGR